MLPPDGPLSDAQRDDVREAVRNYLKKHVISQKDMAKQIGSAPSVLSSVLDGTYKADLTQHDKWLRAMNDWMEIDARRRQEQQPRDFVETRIAKRLIAAASKASQGPLIAVAHGPSGIGKSLVAGEIGKRFPGSLYVRVSKGNTSALSMRKMLATRLKLIGVRRKEQVGLTLDERIFQRLKNSNRLVIIDEAHRLTDSALEFLRDLYDECDLPILLVCTKDLVERIRKDADEDHGQLYSRIGYVCDLVRGFDKHPRGNNPTFLIAEIRKIFGNDDKVRFTPDGEGYLQDVANTLGQGSLRRCKWIMRWAVAIARQSQSGSVLLLDAKILRKAESEPMADKSMLDDIECRASSRTAATA